MRDAESHYLDFEPGEALDQLIGASIRYRIAIGPNAGRKALTLRTVPAQPEPLASTLLAKQPFRDGTTHVVLDPLDFISRLAALVPRPRLNLTRFHGVFAPNCTLRENIVPRREPKTQAPDLPRAPMTWMQRLKRVFAIDIETCSKCGGKLRVYRRALKHGIEDPDVIANILEHIRARDEAQPAQPRAPPLRSQHPDTSNQDRLF